MRDLQKWLDSVNGKFVDIDGKFGAQCVDLMRHYLKYCLGLEPYAIKPARYAKEIFTSFPDAGDANFTKVYNKAYNAPKPGDIVFWKTYPFITGIAGHVGICTWADSMKLIVMNQNYPTNSPSILRKFSYKGVIGWLSPKKS